MTLTNKTRRALKTVDGLVNYLHLPAAAKAEHHTDSAGLPAQDLDIEQAIQEGIAWIGRAQNHSVSADGGVARHFSLITGWGTSYPETTGYLVPTLLAYAKLWGDETSHQRARCMLDWLVSIQLHDGGFQGGIIDSRPTVPVTFNTGQILLGLADGVHQFKD